MPSPSDATLLLDGLPKIPASLRPSGTSSVSGTSALYVVQVRLADGTTIPAAAGGSVDAALVAFAAAVAQRRLLEPHPAAMPDAASWRRIPGVAGRLGGIELVLGEDGRVVQVHAVPAAAF